MARPSLRVTLLLSLLATAAIPFAALLG